MMDEFRDAWHRIHYDDERVTAETAQRIGLVSEIVPAPVISSAIVAAASRP